MIYQCPEELLFAVAIDGKFLEVVALQQGFDFGPRSDLIHIALERREGVQRGGAKDFKIQQKVEQVVVRKWDLWGDTKRRWGSEFTKN